MRSTRREFLAAASGAVACGALWWAPRSAAAAPQWVDQRQFGPFVCESTLPLNDKVSLLAELPVLEQELVRVLGIRPPRQPIYVHILGNRLEHYDYLEANHPGVPHRRAIFVKRDRQAHVIAYMNEELDVDIRHECTHALLHSDLAIVPLWLDEGFAEYFEVTAPQRAFDHPHFDSLRWNLRLGMVRTIEALEERNELADMSGTDYRFSWAWVHFMLHGPKEAFDVLMSFLADIRLGRPAGLFSQRLKQVMPDATERLVAHFKHWRKS